MSVKKKKKNQDKRKKRRGGFYWIEDKPYVTVTTALKSVAKPALRYWFGGEVWQAMIQDPSLSKKEAMAAPWRSSKKAINRGNAVHEIVETWKHTDMFLEKLSDDIKPYANAFKQWIEDFDVEVITNEKSVISEKFRYAGTFDLLVKMGKTKRPVLVDIKTGKNIYDEVFLQLSAYKHALIEMGEADEDLGIAVCNLETGKDGKPTGKYQFKEGEYSFKPYLAARILWDWQNQSKIAKVNASLNKSDRFPKLSISFH